MSRKTRDPTRPHKHRLNSRAHPALETPVGRDRLITHSPPAGSLEKEADPRLDRRSQEALQRLIRIVHRSGGSLIAIERAVQRELRELSSDKSPPENRSEIELPSAAQVMTVWRLDPPYVDRQGQPRPLRRTGRAPSFTSLVRRVDRHLDSNKALTYLLRTGAVRYHDGRCWAVDRAVILRDFAGPRDIRNLRSVDAILRTIEHNLIPASRERAWLERAAESDRVPTRLLPAFARFIERRAMALLTEVDAWLHWAESDAKAGEATLGVTLGIYQSQEDNTPHRRPDRSRKNPTPRPSRAGR